MINKTFNKTFNKTLILLVLMLVCFPSNSFATKKKAKKSYSKNIQITKVHYKTKHIAKLRHFVPVNGVLFQTLKGDILLEQNSQQYFNPASVMKIATSFIALEKLGYDYRFNTNIYTNGKIDQEGSLNGDLIIVGSGDPAMFSENVFFMVDNLSHLGVKKVTGDLLVTTPFYLNFDSPQHSILEIKSIFNGRHWTKPLQEAWTRYTQEQNKPDATFSGVEIEGQARAISLEDLPTEKQLLLTHQSRALSDILKIQNDYSSNFMAEAIGRQVGGPRAIESFLVEKVGINADDVKVVSASGLGENRITPSAALKLLRRFYESVNRNGKRLDELLPAAGVDEGTLDERFTEELRGSVVAKTGTLMRQHASALVGVAYTKEKGPIFFVLLDKDEVIHARRHQDQLVTDMIYQYGGPSPTRSIINGFETRPKVIITQSIPFVERPRKP